MPQLMPIGQTDSDITQKSSKENLSREKEMLRQLSVDDINDTYRRGYITAAQKNDILRRKADVTLETRLDEDGYAMTVFKTWISKIQDGWDDATLGMSSDPQKASEKGIAAGALQSIWGQIQILTAPFNAWGNVNGKVAERLALQAGASPGLAKVINFATDMGTQFIPVGKLAQSGAKGVQKIGAKFAAKAAAEAEGAIAGALPKGALQAVAEGLVTDGVKSVQVAGSLGDEALGTIQQGVKKAASVSEQFADDLARFKKEMAGITATKSHEVTMREAEKLGLSIDDLRHVVPGQALNEVQMAAYLKALDPQVKTLVDLAKTAAKEGTDESVETLAQHASELFTFAPTFRGAEVTAGRSVEILKETPPMKKLTDLLVGWDPESMAKGDFRSAMLTFADDLVAMTDEPQKLKLMAIQNQTMFHQLSTEWWPKARAAYTSLLVAQPITHVRNTIGNSIAATNAVLERSIGGAFSLDPSKGIAGAKEGLYFAKGMRYAIGDGIKAMAKSYEGIGPDELSKMDFVPVRFTGKVSRIFNVPLDTLRGMDNFFKVILRRGSYYAQAFREGSQRGLANDDLASFVARRLTNPTKAMLDEAEAFALHNTFQDDLGRIGTAARALQTGPLALWFPFMKTPLNLAKYSWNRTPGLQLISKSLYSDILAGGVKADMAIGRLTLSNLMGMFIYDLAQEGMLTGSGPVDPGLRRSWLLQYQPYSLKFGDGWVPISQMEPASTMPGLVADFAQTLNQLDQPTAEQGAMAISLAISRDITDKTYWKTMSDLVDLAGLIRSGEEPGAQAKKIILGPAVTVLTGGPLVSGITRGIDPIRRETRSFVDELIARTPGYSKTLPPMRDSLGEPILPPQAIGSSYLSIASPLRYQERTDDPVATEASKLQVKLPIFPWNIGGRMRDDFDIRAPMPGDRLPVELSPKQRDRWQVMYRDLIRSPQYGIQSMLLDNPIYQQAPQALKRELFADHLATLRSTAKESLLVEDPELTTKLLKSEASHYYPMLQAQEQEKLNAQVGESVDLLNSLAPEARDNLLRWGVIEPGDETKAVIQ